MATTVPRFSKLLSRSAGHTAAAVGSSRKRGTKCEELLLAAMRKLRLRPVTNVDDLPGKPDFVFAHAHVVVFCDGDFWHGRDLETRLKKLAVGHNPQYWTAKIQRNVERDREQEAELIRRGWVVLRCWERDIRRDVKSIAIEIATEVRTRREPAARRYVRQLGIVSPK